jgi:hypothetical protein
LPISGLEVTIPETGGYGSRSGSTISTEFRLRFRCLLAAPVLWAVGESALHKDLIHLKNVLESA